jgi:hypothetical protein
MTECTVLPVDRVAITYHRQAIPSPIRMPCYELFTGIISSTQLIQSSQTAPTGPNIDMTGARVEAYIQHLLDIAYEMTCQNRFLSRSVHCFLPYNAEPDVALH